MFRWFNQHSKGDKNSKSNDSSSKNERHSYEANPIWVLVLIVVSVLSAYTLKTCLHSNGISKAYTPNHGVVGNVGNDDNIDNGENNADSIN